MQKIYGTTTILIASIFALMFGGVLVLGLYGAIQGESGALALLIQPLIFLFPIYLLIVRGKKIFTGHIIISEPEPLIKMIFFYLGGLLLVISLLVLGYTVGLMVYLIVTKTSGIPAGIGIGLALMPFMLGACLVESTANASKIKNTELINARNVLKNPVALEDYCKETGVSREEVEDEISRGKLRAYEYSNKLFIDYIPNK